MHESAFKFVEDTVKRLEPRQSVIELGSRTVPGPWPYSGPVRPLFTSARSYTGVDMQAGPNVDELGNAAKWHPRWLVDTVVCCETLEHTPEGDDICDNALSMLEPGGVFIVTAAGEGRAPHSCVDGGPVLRDWEHYANVTRDDLRIWLKPFRFFMIDAFTSPGDIHAIAVKAG